MKAVRILTISIMLAAIFLTVFACQDIASPLEDFKWVLIQYTQSGNEKTPLADTEISAFFESKTKTVTGSGGVNSYGGKYTVDHLTMKVTDMTWTLVSGGEAKDTQEQSVLKILSNADRFEMDHGQLFIYAGQDRLVFKNTNSTVKPPTHWGG
jgi:heat shock protein HslJ